MESSQSHSVSEVLVDEDTVVDTERNHITEQAVYLLFE